MKTWQRVVIPPDLRRVYTRCSYCGRTVDQSDAGDVLVSLWCNDHDMNVNLGACCLGKPRGRWAKCIARKCEIDAGVWAYRPASGDDPGAVLVLQ